MKDFSHILPKTHVETIMDCCSFELLKRVPSTHRTKDKSWTAENRTTGM